MSREGEGVLDGRGGARWKVKRRKPTSKCPFSPPPLHFDTWALESIPLYLHKELFFLTIILYIFQLSI